MAVFPRHEDQSKETETIIGASVAIEGAFVGAGDVSVEGKVTGTLRTKKNLRIGPGSIVKADIEGANIMIAGEVRGQVKCAGRFEVAASGKVYGNVETQTIAIAHGAVLHGKVTMVPADSAPIKEAKKS